MRLISILTFICAVLSIYFDYFDKRMEYFFKPLTILLLIASLWLYGSKTGSYRWLLVGAFIFSIVGDVALINPQNFVIGLAAFFVAHLFYMAAFFVAGDKSFDWRSLVGFLVGLLVFLSVVSGVPPELMIAVIAYTLVLSGMLTLAINLWLTRKDLLAQFAFWGAILFAFSDSVIAFNKFVHPFVAAKLVTLATYFVAQWLIARSAWNRLA